MTLTHLHARILARAFEGLLGLPDSGSVAYARCLSPDLAHGLAANSAFDVAHWHHFCVAAEDNMKRRIITADRAVEMRETKQDATLLLVDTEESGAGMDGIYSAAREVQEADLFDHALKLAYADMADQLSPPFRNFAERAVQKARARGLYSVSRWTEFDFLCRAIDQKIHPGAFLHLLGLWPVLSSDEANAPGALDTSGALDESRFFVERLLGARFSGISPRKRIEALRFLQPTEQQSRDLEQFLRHADANHFLTALSNLAAKEHLWINALRRQAAAHDIQSIELLPWRTKAGKIARWSGLRESENPNDPPVFTLDPDAERASDYSQLEVRWRAEPDNLEKDAVEYRVQVMTEMGEELAVREVAHSARSQEKCRFNNDDFSDLGDGALISARVTVSVIGDSQIEPKESEEFIIRFGEPLEQERIGGGKKVRAFSEGVIDLETRETVSNLVAAMASSECPLQLDAKGSLTLRTPQRGKAYQVFQPPLIRMVEKQWLDHDAAIGRWILQVRSSGEMAAEPEFEPFAQPNDSPDWTRARTGNQRIAARLVANGGSVAQIYDESSPTFNTVKEYLLAWAALLEKGDPLLALANTIEVQSLSGRTIGLIVLPTHPLRLAWHAAYDNLALHARFVQDIAAQHIRDEFLPLDGAMFPAFLPGLQAGHSFVFADTLGFHAVGMVRDDDREPKATAAMLARALGDGDGAESARTTSNISAKALADEIIRYLECHKKSRLLHIHALRAGDGMTVARSLGHVHDHYSIDEDEQDQDKNPHELTPAFVLEFYPSAQQHERDIAGRFISQAREKRRSGAGVLSSKDAWMLESVNLPGEVRLPRLRWARKDQEQPDRSAHLAIAFDALDARVVAEDADLPAHPFHAYGLLNSSQTIYAPLPSPTWRSAVPRPKEGERHPSDRTHTDRLTRLHEAIHSAVARNIGADGKRPALKAEISPANADDLHRLHHLCDWVITLDRNAGLEFFDSPQDSAETYSAYVVDCVPARADLGSLQLITSTGNHDEILGLLAGTLNQMGLANEPCDETELLRHLKALSGRLALRLTGHSEPGLDLISLALSFRSCLSTPATGDCWLSLNEGFLIPARDVHELLPPLDSPTNDPDETVTRPTLIFVSVSARKGLSFQFVEVNCRRHLRSARSPDLLNAIAHRLKRLRKEWNRWYDSEEVKPAVNAIRRARLAAVLRFYADRARRHHLPAERHETIMREIDRMISKGQSYTFAEYLKGDRGWIFCPEFASEDPHNVSTAEEETEIFLFGPNSLPEPVHASRPMADTIHVERDPTPDTRPPKDANVGETERETEAGRDTTPSLGQLNDTGNETAGETKEVSAFEAPSICIGSEIYGGDEVHWPLTTQGNPHLLLAGLPGMGKTTCLLNICKQMLISGVRPLIFSYHQDIDERLEKIVDSVRYIDCYGLGFNPLQVIDRNSRLAYLDVAGAVRDIFTAIFPELGDIQGEHIRRAIKDSFVEAGWDTATADLSKLREPEFKRFLEILKADPKPDRGLRTLLARLEELEDYGFFELAETRASLWDGEQPIVIRIHTTQNDNLQKAFASLIFYGLYKDMFRRGIQDRITHAVIFDEAHRAAGLKLIPTMAKECRKYGISLVLASQEARDFERSLFSAIANYLVLRLTETDARSLVRMVGSSRQEKELIDKIKQMDRFRALCFSEGKKRPSFVNLMDLED